MPLISNFTSNATLLSVNWLTVFSTSFYLPLVTFTFNLPTDPRYRRALGVQFGWGWVLRGCAWECRKHCPYGANQFSWLQRLFQCGRITSQAAIFPRQSWTHIEWLQVHIRQWAQIFWARHFKLSFLEKIFEVAILFQLCSWFYMGFSSGIAPRRKGDISLCRRR